MIPAANEMSKDYSEAELGKMFTQGDTLEENFKQGLAINGFAHQDSKDGKLNFGGKTVNNLPLLLEVTIRGSASEGVSIKYRVPVMPLQKMMVDALESVLRQ